MSRKDRPFAPTRRPVAPRAVERPHGWPLQPQHALANAFAGFIGKRIKADQHGADMVTLAGVLIDNPCNKLRAGAHERLPAGEDGPQPYSGSKYDHHSQPGQNGGPTPLNSPDIVLGKLSFRDEALALGESFAFLICE